MTKYFDLLIQRLHENCDQPVNMVHWFDCTTFDIIGDLTFGESFNCLQDAKLHVRSHPLHLITYRYSRSIVLGNHLLPISQRRASTRPSTEILATR